MSANDSIREEKARVQMLSYTKQFKAATISANEVQQLEQDGTRAILVDVRTADERSVSMLRGAVTSTQFDALVARNEIDKSMLIVPYCTIGYRSGVFADKIAAEGFSNVRNSEGIVLWSYSDAAARIVNDKDQPVTRVHVYGDTWDLAHSSFTTVRFGIFRAIYKFFFP